MTKPCRRCGRKRGHHPRCGTGTGTPRQPKPKLSTKEPSTAAFILDDCFIPSMKEPSCQNESGSVPSRAEREFEFDGGIWNVILERLP